MRQPRGSTPALGSFLAVAVSIAFSPFAYLTLYLLATVARGGPGLAVPALELWTGLGLVPALGIYWAVRRGVWSDLELSRLSDRRTLLPLACAAYAVVTWLASLQRLPGPLRFAAASLLLATMAATAVTLFWKISLHTCCAGQILALSWLQLGPGAAAAAGMIALALAWSRLRLGRHDLPQVVAGLGLGLAAALALAAM